MDSFLSYLPILKLKTICENYLKSNLSPSNCFEIFDIAQMLEHDLITSIVKSYIKNNFQKITKGISFCKLSKSQVSFVLEDSVDTEDNVMDGLLAWIKYDKDIREEYLEEIISSVINVNFLSKEYICDIITNNEIIMSNLKVTKLLSQQLLTYLNPKKFMKSNQKLPRGILGYYILQDSGEYFHIDVIADTLTSMPNFKSKTEYTGSYYTINNKVFLIGGINETTVKFSDLPTTQRPNPKWKLLRPLTVPRRQCGVIALDKKLLIIGGLTLNDEEGGYLYLSTTEQIDMEFTANSNHCQRLCDMSFERCSPALVYLHGLVYAIGGYNGHKCLSVAERLNIEQNHWFNISPMNVSRKSAAACCFNDKIYVLGGNNGVSLKSVEFYDPRSDSWTIIASLNIPRTSFGAYVIGSILYAVGGTNKKTDSAYESFNLSNNVDDEVETLWNNQTNIRRKLNSCIIGQLSR